MLFNSYLFILFFLPIVYLIYWYLRNRRARLVWLLTASYVFYAYLAWQYLGLLLFVTALNYVAGNRIGAAATDRAKRNWLWAGVGANLALLGYYKYYNFGAESVNSLATTLGLGPFLPTIVQPFLPLGISFVTFTAIEYLLSVKRKRVKQPSDDPLVFAVHMALFAKVISGPIAQYNELVPQLENLPAERDDDRQANGIQYFVIGLAEKLILADTLVMLVDPLFADYPSLDFISAWLLMFAYAYQVYFDFDGYTNMAIGVGLFFGLKLPPNFNSPYKAQNVSDLWNRWHISLTRWFRDLIFLPLSWNLLKRWGKQAQVRVQVVLSLLVMALIGLWHGANWTFILWGLYHGALLGWYHFRQARGWTVKNPWINRFGTFVLFTLGLVLFRSTDLGMAASIYKSLLGLSGPGSLDAFIQRAPALIPLLIVGFVIVNFLPNAGELEGKLPRRAYVAAAMAGAMVFSVLLMGREVPFVYFRF